VTRVVTVGEFLERSGESLQLEDLGNGQGLERPIPGADLSSPGLALAGYVDRFVAERLQVLGETEITYLASLPTADRERILSRFFDFPLPVHKNTMAASNAAACAADQGKFWEMHDELFRNQPEWNGEATDNPKKIFLGYVKALGLNSDTWEKCFDAQTHQSRIMANQAEGTRRRVQSTPTFVIGTRMIPGGMSYDAFKAYVDSATKEAAVPAKTDTAAAKGKTK
jgi:hypothetical protein